MLQIQHVSELRNYNKVLNKVKKDNPVFLTKNGYGKFALIDIEEYDEFTTALELVNKLKKLKNQSTIILMKLKENYLANVLIKIIKSF
ncbi:type II toxin-antitoxin system prevent-host-death family antitoxin [Lactobacillus sp. IBH004]|uniref:type II toxin-antitoxin system prevent-host-death family antitoxin n=1 Tax=unclassified Lactobacillus TaxID=2620435 RepID=UPI001F3792E0|nr:MULTISPECIES: type II toxin-antitoxin system prevent-host-death family antitoxin [unclassified Lactobacillus]UZN42199.1 type II toxin-antitoxin system prevent-host-death family antitoxin [Lactobacillus sp. IBH004]